MIFFKLSSHFEIESYHKLKIGSENQNNFEGNDNKHYQNIKMQILRYLHVIGFEKHGLIIYASF